MMGQPGLYEVLEKLSIDIEYHEHPPIATIEDAKIHWKDLDSGRCKNIFFRNHKGDKHYLVILEHLRQLNSTTLKEDLNRASLPLLPTRDSKNTLVLNPDRSLLLALLTIKITMYICSSMKN
jgi:Ala-tRNA(Pro) deacylase